MKLSSAVRLGLCGALAVAPVAAAQRPAPSPETPSSGMPAVAIALQAGSDSYRFSGRAACTHEPKGYIYTVAAQLWSVQQTDATRDVTLTFWRPADGSGDMFTLHLQTGDRRYAADTVKTKDGGSPQGSGKVTFASEGRGGTFTVNAKTASGATITGTIKCDGFRPAMAEGGN